MTVNSLRDVIKVNDNFKNAINLFLNLNKTDKILSYIPTKSSVNILRDYIENVYSNKEQASLLIGPYGKGKSHLLLILLAILTLERNSENTAIIQKVISKIEVIDSTAAKQIDNIWNNKKKFLPVIISNSYADLNQAFLLGINDALKKENLEDLVPETYYSSAIDVINNWKSNYKDTFNKFKEMLKEKEISFKNIMAQLKSYNREALDVFKEVYPSLTSGSSFNPMVNTDVLPLYKSINDKLCEEYSYSGIYIIFDEFSKFIESRNNKKVGNEMKLLQDMCELAEDSKKDSQLFITMVTHKSIKEYGEYLSQNIINAFLGIEGRITEKYFVTSSKNNYELIQNAIIKEDGYTEDNNIQKYFNPEDGGKYYDIPAFNTIFKYEDFENIIWKGCYPLNPISSYLLLNISEKVAQNERTLFTFISKDESKSMARYIKTHEEDEPWIINANMIYDYFKNTFKKDISNVYVHSEWIKADYSISKTKDADEKKVLKCIALINIVNKYEELPSTKNIIALASGIQDIDHVLDELMRKELIAFKKNTNCYYFKTKAGSNLKKEVDRRRTLRNINYNVNSILESIYNKKFEIPKQYNQDTCMTRYFRYEFIDYNTFMSIDKADVFLNQEHFCDGKIIMLVCEKQNKLNEDEVLDKINTFKEPRLIILKPSKPIELLNQIEEYQVLQQIKEDKTFMNENKVLENEIEIFEEEIKEIIINYINEAYELKNKAKAYYYEDDEAKIYKDNSINRLVGSICRKTYYNTPIINNELMNKERINTSQMKKARKVIIEYNLSQKNDEDFYSGTNAEATIYRCAFVRTNIIDGNVSGGMKAVLDEIQNFIHNCNNKKVCLAELIDTLVKPPFGMRRGIMPLYLSYMLSSKVEDAVVYFGNKELLISADIIINMCENPNDYKLLISTSTIEKDRYIDKLMNMFNVQGNYNLSNSKMNNIIISMQRWFRALPQITRSFRTNIYIDTNEKIFNALLLLKKILQKIDANPYEILFIKLPEVCSNNMNLEETAEVILQIKKILENYLDTVVKNTCNNIMKIFRENSKQDLYHLLKEWLDNQDDISKQGILGNVENDFINYIQELNIYDDMQITKDIVKIISDTYIENWNDGKLDEFLKELTEVKEKIENVDNEEIKNKRVITFIDSNGHKVTKYYEDNLDSDDNSSNIMKNIIEGTLDDFVDMDVNEKLNVLVQMIEKVLAK